jgi:hypothetical protein
MNGSAARRTFAAWLLTVSVLGGCGMSSGAAQPTPTAGAEGLPVNPAIAQVAASALTADAADALQACGFANFDSKHPGAGGLKIGVVASMGLVSPGRDAAKYALLDGAPEIDTTTPLWLIVTDTTWILLPMGTDELREATCVVPDGQWGSALWFVTGDRRHRDGSIESPRPHPDSQVIWKLPPLGP